MHPENPFSVGTALETNTPTAAQRHYGGLRRTQTAAILLGTWMLGALVLFTVANIRGAVPATLILALNVIGILVALTVILLRLKNIGVRPAVGLLLLIPIGNLVGLLACLAIPEGYAHHRTLDTPGKLLTGLFLAAITIAVTILVLR